MFPHISYASQWFAPTARGESTGNPVRIRGCPAAVSGNDRRQKHWFGSLGLGSDGH
jgi:hypothetical protein